MEHMLKSETRTIADTYPALLSSETQAKLDYLLDALENMDQRIALELERVKMSPADEELKDFVRQDILANHEASRLPLVQAVEDLRAQYRVSIADNSN
ncbi:hypothetical protein DC522_08090 [Microvirga sp. KLBC 81]|uniref:hypothetical protein n=1 Tax=Microvirga sp. KLBC 81 TaxID=1862707 RepID=UPI000D51D50B|nr:hypothetical protein [Microvirga sp. KLBC 81]PVE24873.1 hypothetical protein DC522_08090 [Microvirga sp. KLBC 81]